MAVRIVPALRVERRDRRGLTPLSETLESPWVGPAAKTMTPDWLHVPPLPSGAVQRASGEPPAASIVFSFPAEKMPSEHPSGDQKGFIAPSVLESARASLASRDRT